MPRCPGSQTGGIAVWIFENEGPCSLGLRGGSMLALWTSNRLGKLCRPTFFLSFFLSLKRTHVASASRSIERMWDLHSPFPYCKDGNQARLHARDTFRNFDVIARVNHPSTAFIPPRHVKFQPYNQLDFDCLTTNGSKATCAAQSQPFFFFFFFFITAKTIICTSGWHHSASPIRPMHRFRALHAANSRTSRRPGRAEW